jgi:hypothetical protein
LCRVVFGIQNPGQDSLSGTPNHARKGVMLIWLG